MKTLGTEFVLSAEDVKDHYDALGGGLHIPTMAQFQNDKLPDPVVVRARCDEVVSIVDRVLSSKVWNSTLGLKAYMDCSRCKNLIRRRMPYGVKSIEVECFECKALYTVEDQGDGKVLWKPVMKDAPCADPNCTGKMPLWPADIKVGTYWTCKECGGVSELQLRVGVKGAD